MNPKRSEPSRSKVGGCAPALWRKELGRDFERALAETKLPERPDYEGANRFLIKARMEMANDQGL